MVASTHTDDHGGFSLSLPAGRRYLIHATNIGGYRSTAQQMVDVGGGLIARITLTVDTGIR